MPDCQIPRAQTIRPIDPRRLVYELNTNMLRLYISKDYSYATAVRVVQDETVPPARRYSYSYHSRTRRTSTVMPTSVVQCSKSTSESRIPSAYPKSCISFISKMEANFMTLPAVADYDTVMASLKNFTPPEMQGSALVAFSRRTASAACESCLKDCDFNAVGAMGRARFEDVYEPIAGSLCGSGSTSIVVQVRRRCDGRVFACKVCCANGHLCDSDDDNNCQIKNVKCQQDRQIRREIEIMAILRRTLNIQGGYSVDVDFLAKNVSSDFDDHGIAMYVGDVFVSTSCIDSSTKVYMVCDLMKGGDLWSALQERGSYAEDDARAVMKQLLRSLVFLHDDVGITHRDVKLENILLPSELDPAKIKLSDFGLSAVGTSAFPSMKQRCGTPAYVAPEILERNPLYSNKVDLWSSGVVLFMLLSGYPPFWGSTMNKLLHSIRNARPEFNDPVWELISEEAQNLVQKLLTKNPEERLSAREALLHPWLAEAQ